eukprot:2974545-Rhodomonas_salina.1
MMKTRTYPALVKKDRSSLRTPRRLSCCLGRLPWCWYVLMAAPLPSGSLRVVQQISPLAARTERALREHLVRSSDSGS